MKTSINRNILWTELFAEELVNMGVKYACISPGSRNTPLTLGFASNKNIKSYLLIDERSCGFYGLGLAKATNTPVVLVSTSGTAAAEFYPAIIEAYQQHVPLIICTADRPPELLDCGANQTINQDNLYRNHILWYFNVGVPEPAPERLLHIRSIARRAFSESSVLNKGPVHLNFPFRKPFEPFVYTDEISDDILNEVSSTDSLQDVKRIHAKSSYTNELNHITSLISAGKRSLIIVGPDQKNPGFITKLTELSELLSIPILADGASQLRNGSHSKNNVFVNFEGYLRSEAYSQLLQPDVILHFGRTVTSKGLELFLENSRAIRYMINEFGDWYDPSNKSLGALAVKPEQFCDTLLSEFRGKEYGSGSWLSLFEQAETTAAEVKDVIVDKAEFPFEGRVITEAVSMMPDNSCLMISNSMPVRDLDYFSPKTSSNIDIYFNRGASGIDGITSTALGLSEASGKPAVLITGDLAFYYDLNGLLTSKKYNIPIVIVLINNNGGGIFEMLPISRYDDYFREYFVAPHDLDFSHFVKGYDGSFYDINSWEQFRSLFLSSLEHKGLSVLQINTNSKHSAMIRREYWNKVDEQLIPKTDNAIRMFLKDQ